MWLDIHAPNGSRLGPGPLITATGWQATRKLDRAGEFSFSLPLAEPRASYLQAFRTVRAWDMVGGTLRELGAGTIKRMDATISASGADMLTVSGPDILEELSRVAVGDLQVFDTVIEHPSTALWLTGIYHHEMAHYGDAAVVMTNALDGAAGDTSTYATISIDANNRAIEIRATRAFHGIQLRFGPNVNMAAGPEMTLQYWDPATRFSPLYGLGDWVTLSGIEDGTNRAAEDAEPLHLGQDGTIFFIAPAEWVAVDGYYRLRIIGDDIGYSVTGNLDIADICIVYERPTADALAKIMAFAPAGWSLDAAHGLSATEGTVYWQAAGESVLECLVRVAELTGEHFSAGYSGRQVIWWGTAQEVAPLRAVGGPGLDGLAIADNVNVCLITRLTEILDAYGLATRVTPTGAGTGAARITLADISDPLPAGYSLDGDTLVRDAAEAALGRIEKRLDCPDVEATDNSLEQRQYAANALLKQAHEWLRTHSATDTNRLTGDMPRAYTLAVTKADRVLWPNHTLRTVYRAYRDGVKVWDIDRYLTILSAMTEYSGDGLRTVALEVATVQTQTDNDALNALQIRRDARAMRAHGVNPVGTVLTGPSSGLDMTALAMALDADYTPAAHALDTAASQHVGGVGLHTHAGPDSTGGQVAHSVLGGLTTGDPHTQYLNTTRHLTIGDTAPHHTAITLDTNADTLLSLSTQALGLDTQAANLIFAGPTSGGAAVPGFRLLVAADIPAGYLLATGATTGATAQAQTFTNGILGPSWKPLADGATALTIGPVTGAAALTMNTVDGLLSLSYRIDTKVSMGGYTAPVLAIFENQAVTDGTTQVLLTGHADNTNLAYGPNRAGAFIMLRNANSTNGNYSGFGFRNANFVTSGAMFCLNVTQGDAGTAEGALAFYTRNTTGFNEVARIDKDGWLGLGTPTPSTLLHAISTTATTNAVVNILTLGHDTSGTAAAGFGLGLNLLLESSTTAAQSAARIATLWNVATHASRSADLVFYASDSGGERELARGRATGTAAAWGFLGAAPSARIAHVADPAGGTTIDAEARTAVNSILATLETFGFHAVA